MAVASACSPRPGVGRVRKRLESQLDGSISKTMSTSPRGALQCHERSFRSDGCRGFSIQCDRSLAMPGGAYGFSVRAWARSRRVCDAECARHRSLREIDSTGLLRQPLGVRLNVYHWNGATELQSGDEFQKKGRGRLAARVDIVNRSISFHRKIAVGRHAANI